MCLLQPLWSLLNGKVQQAARCQYHQDLFIQATLDIRGHELLCSRNHPSTAQVVCSTWTRFPNFDMIVASDVNDEVHRVEDKTRSRTIFEVLRSYPQSQSSQ